MRYSRRIYREMKLVQRDGALEALDALLWMDFMDDLRLFRKSGHATVTPERGSITSIHSDTVSARSDSSTG